LVPPLAVRTRGGAGQSAFARLIHSSHFSNGIAPSPSKKNDSSPCFATRIAEKTAESQHIQRASSRKLSPRRSFEIDPEKRSCG
jgi:hypothetical protein